MEEAFDGGLDKRSLKALAQRSDTQGLVQLASHALALALTGGLVLAAPGLWLLPALMLHGVALIFLFAPLHESIHRTAFASRRLNDAVAWVCGALLVLPPEYFRAFHFAHHRYTQDPDRDFTRILSIARRRFSAEPVWLRRYWMSVICCAYDKTGICDVIGS